LVTDEKDVFNDVLQCVKVKVTDFEMAMDETSAIQFFESIKPDVVLFKHASINDSERIYQQLINQSKEFINIKHRAVLICESRDINTAFKKCIANIFFDYLVFKPEIDRCRINLQIKKAIESIALENERSSNRDISKLGRSVSQQGSNMMDPVKEVDEISGKAQAGIHSAAQNIKSSIKKYSTKLVEKSNASSTPLTELEINDEAEIYSQFNVENILQECSQHVSSSMLDFKQRMALNKKKYDEVLSRLDDLSSKLTKKVLLVEDNDVYREMVKTMLEQTGEYSVEATSCVYQAVSAIAAVSPDVVLLDYELEDGDAGDFLEKIAEIPDVKNIPVIMLTSHANNDVYTTTQMLGAKEFIKKPANKAIIIEKIKQVLL